MRTKYRPRTFGLELAMIVVGLLFLYPVYVLVELSLEDSGKYGGAWRDAHLGAAMINSTIITVASLVCLVLVGSTASYYLARTHTKLSYGMYLLFLLGIVLPFQLFLRALPREYGEAALVDGATQWQSFTRITFPLLRPITGTVIILNAVFVWNDFVTPLVYLGVTATVVLPGGETHEVGPGRRTFTAGRASEGEFVRARPSPQL